MKRFVIAIFIIFSLICALANCSVPIGSIEKRNNRKDIEAMWLIPHRQLYQIDDKFMRDKDFQLFIVEVGGRVEEVLPDPTFPDVGAKVFITGNESLTTEFTEYMKLDHHALHQVGTHKITVAYDPEDSLIPALPSDPSKLTLSLLKETLSKLKIKSSYYIIEVFSPNNGNTLGGDDGIGIIWLD